jgi:hypothetical protein
LCVAMHPNSLGLEEEMVVLKKQDIYELFPKVSTGPALFSRLLTLHPNPHHNNHNGYGYTNLCSFYSYTPP